MKTKKKKIFMFLFVVACLSIFLFFKFNPLSEAPPNLMMKDTKTKYVRNKYIRPEKSETFKELLKTWEEQDNDKHMQDKSVVNILLLGIDSKFKMSDSMILVSISEKDKKITMTSFYRDSYLHMRDKSGNEYYGKLNHAYTYGGAEMVKETIENNYKIHIDNYVVADYKSFPKIIDTLGGVTVNVKPREAEYLNRTWYKWSMTHKKIQFSSGDFKMDGEHALMFCRIRGLDDDVWRQERQKRVLNAIVKEFKSASLSEINSCLNAILPYIKTDMTKTEILKYISRAGSKNWVNYKTETIGMPSANTRTEGFVGKEWIWYCDYPFAANQLARKIYGYSNILIDKDYCQKGLEFSYGNKKPN